MMFGKPSPKGEINQEESLTKKLLNIIGEAKQSCDLAKIALSEHNQAGYLGRTVLLKGRLLGIKMVSQRVFNYSEMLLKQAPSKITQADFDISRDLLSESKAIVEFYQQKIYSKLGDISMLNAVHGSLERIKSHVLSLIAIENRIGEQFRDRV